MRIKVKIKSGREWVKKAALKTVGKRVLNKEMSDEMFASMLLSGDSPAKEYELWIECYDIPDKVHTHIVRHERIGKYVQRSKEENTPSRNLILKIDALRFIEICRLRLCGKAWNDTIKLFEMIAKEVIEVEPCFDGLLYPMCVWYGGCPMGDSCCHFNKSLEYKAKREKFVNLIKKRLDMK